MAARGSSEPVRPALRCCHFLPQQSGRYLPRRFHASKKLRFARRLTVREITETRRYQFDRAVLVEMTNDMIHNLSEAGPLAASMHTQGGGRAPCFLTE